MILEVRKQIEQELTKVIDFEEKLAQISPQRLEMLRPDMLTPYSIDQLSDEFPFLDWRAFFDSALQNTDDEGRYTLSIVDYLQNFRIFKESQKVHFNATLSQYTSHGISIV